MARHKACDEGNNGLLPRSITQWIAVFRLSPIAGRGKALARGGLATFLGLHGVKRRSWYSYHLASFALFSPKTAANAAVNETSTDPH
jgi:hypothetical protein